MTFLIAAPGTAPPPLLVASPWAAPAPALEGEVMLTEAGLADLLTRAAVLLARMRGDRDAARGVAATVSSRLEGAAATLSAASRDLGTAAAAEVKARRDVQRAVQAGDQEGHHWGRVRLQTETHALRRAEDHLRDCMAGHAAIEREGAIAKQRADFLDASIAAAERQAVLLAATVDAPGGPAAS